MVPAIEVNVGDRDMCLGQVGIEDQGTFGQRFGTVELRFGLFNAVEVIETFDLRQSAHRERVVGVGFEGALEMRPRCPETLVNPTGSEMERLDDGVSAQIGILGL